MALLDIPKSVAKNIVGQACTLKLVSTSSYLHYFVYLLIFFPRNVEPQLNLHQGQTSQPLLIR